MEFRRNVTHKYLGIPVKTASVEDQDLRILEIYSQAEKIMEFKIPVSEQKPCAYDYLAYINVEDYKGGELCLSGRLPSAFFDHIVQEDEPKQEAVIRPEIHFTSERGWINDPNGLVFHDGTWHLYFQHNPMNTEWENLSWGHAVSRDLLCWEQKDTVLYPDRHGTMFSGCGLVNERGMFGLSEDALLFFYTVAGNTSRWSEGKQFVQRMAYSLDGGDTLVKYEDWELRLYPEAGKDPGEPLPKAAYENRDPKIFWHEASGAYIMVLFLDGHDFAIFRSANLEDWEKTQHLAFEAAWECPDLMLLEADDGTEHWVFWSADGFYFLGEFDGWEFRARGGQREAYGTKLPYAAQTFSGAAGRTISVAWLRTRHEGRPYTGAMALPRELSLVKTGEDYRLRLAPVRELDDAWEPFQTVDMINGCMEYKEPGRPFCMVLTWGEGEPGRAFLAIGDTRWNIDRKQGIIEMAKEPGRTPDLLQKPGQGPIMDLCVIVDRGIVEITANHDIIYLVYETTDYQMDGLVTFEGDEAEARVAILRENQ